MDAVQNDKAERLGRREENLNRRKKGSVPVREPGAQDGKNQPPAAPGGGKVSSPLKKVRAGFEGKAKSKFLNKSTKSDA